MTASLDVFSLHGEVAAVVGGGGVLGRALTRGLAQAGARVAVCTRRLESARSVAGELAVAGCAALPVACDAGDPASLEAAVETIDSQLGAVTVLVTAVGGNLPAATTSPERSFFDLPLAGLEEAIHLNLFAGAILPAQVFGRRMKDRADGGSIITISSMSADRPLTRILGYSSAKAAVNNFTRWLAVHMAQEYNPRLRVNAIAPGFFLTEQNRFLLLDAETGELTPRGRSVLAHTPMGEFGRPDDLIGAVIWLASRASRFVTGIVLPVDGGFSAFSGV